MNLICTECANLPPLAWLARLGGDGIVQVQHGNLVETGDGFFVEGVWNGAFEAADFHQTDCFFGTGGRLVGASLLITPSAATNSYCYYAARSGFTTVSNSLALLLAALDDELDPACLSYIEINNTILKGIHKIVSTLPTKRGAIERLMHHNLIVSPDGIRKEEKPFPPAFQDFSDYRDYLALNYRLICDNARDSGRRRALRIASTQSKGYDSTAINAIAAPYGLDQVFSIAQGKMHGKFADDDASSEVDDGGREIGEALGFSCTFIERRAILEQPQREHLYYSAVHASEDTNMAGINPHIVAPTALLIGVMGEITSPWRYYHSYYGAGDESVADLERADHGGNALDEVRLSVGFITIPLFYVGARRRRDIQDICDSAAMDPWRLNNNYDRPMARRLAEEGGVPRHLFGQKKNATAMVFTPPVLPLGEALRMEYIEFLDKAGIQSRWKWNLLPVVHALNRLTWFASPRQNRWIYYSERLITRIIGRNYSFPIIWRHLNCVFYSFCVNKRVGEYRELLAAQAAGRN